MSFLHSPFAGNLADRAEDGAGPRERRTAKKLNRKAARQVSKAIIVAEAEIDLNEPYEEVDGQTFCQFLALFEGIRNRLDYLKNARRYWKGEFDGFTFLNDFDQHTRESSAFLAYDELEELWNDFAKLVGLFKSL